MIPDTFTEVGVRLPLLVSGWGALVLLLVAAVAGFSAIRARYDADIREGVFVFSGGIGVLVGIVWVALLIPYSGEYHHIYRVETHVESVSNVITESSGDLTRTPVLTLTNVDRPVTMTDPRAVELEGRDVTLSCTINWHYEAADTYQCSIYSLTPSG